ncbi:zinc ribbon domain-containing protein [bacterium]|nr:zinc ribbon domain-containing protein [bacterium]
MPIYEYDCLKCGSVFEELVRNSRDSSTVVCPSCSSSRVKKRFSLFGFRSKGESGETRTSSSSCASCSATTCSSCKT